MSVIGVYLENVFSVVFKKPFNVTFAVSRCFNRIFINFRLVSQSDLRSIRIKATRRKRRLALTAASVVSLFE